VLEYHALSRVGGLAHGRTAVGFAVITGVRKEAPMY
jgi:hypothetical protein